MCSRVRLGGRHGPSVMLFSLPDRCADLSAVSCRQPLVSCRAQPLLHPGKRSSSSAVNVGSHAGVASGRCGLTVSRSRPPLPASPAARRRLLGRPL